MAHIKQREYESSITGETDKPSRAESTSPSLQARQRRRIAQLEEKLEALEAGRASKERYSHHFMYKVGITYHRAGNRIIIWLKDGRSGVLFLCSIILRTLLLKMTEDTTYMMMVKIMLSKPFAP